MPVPAFGKRTLLAASFFCAWLAANSAAADCNSAHINATVAVSRVLDGDTVILTDGRHLRFIGLNTPELARDERPTEPLAAAATQRLQHLLRPSPHLQLQFGVERHDRYGRLLAHPFLPDGRNLSALLLREGLGFRIAVPPNLQFQNCYDAAEQQARQHARGVWHVAAFRTIPADQLARSDTGFRRVHGRISRVGESRTAWWLNMGRGFALRLPKKDRDSFDIAPRQLAGKTLTVRGWVYYVERKGELRMNLRHPGMIEEQGTGSE